MRSSLAQYAIFGALMFATGAAAGILYERANAPVPPPIEAPRLPEPPRDEPHVIVLPAVPTLDASRAESSVSSERAILDLARAAIARSNAEEALTAIERHAERHARGELAEERDALRVRALVIAGDADGARRAAELFHAAHPESPLTASVDAALEALSPE